MKYNELRLQLFDIEEDLNFLNQYQYEQSYYHQLEINPVERIAFTKHKVKRRLMKQNEHNNLYCIRDDNRIYLLFGTDINELHTSVFNHTVIEIGPFYFLDQSNYEDVVNIMQSFFSSLKSENPVFYKCKIDNSDYMSIKLLQECGFKYVTSALKLVYNPNRDKEIFETYYNSKLTSIHDNFEVRAIDYNDFSESVDLLISQHKKSVHHYMYENVFPQSLIETLFRQWFIQYAHKPQTTILGLLHKYEKTLLGFTSFSGPFLIGNTPVYSRDLTVIHKNYIGNGLALLLYKKMNDITNSCIEGNPLSDNYRNVQFNQRCGYSIVQSRCYLSKFNHARV